MPTQCEACKQDVETEEETQARFARIVGLATTSFQGAVDPSALPPPDTLELTLVRVLAGLWRTYFFGSSAVTQTDVSAVLAHMRNTEDPLMEPLEPMHRMMVVNTFVKPMQAERRRFLESKGLTANEPETTEQLRNALDAFTP